MKPVTFTEYRLPGGRKVHIDVPDKVADRAHALQGQGMVFEMEKLTTGEISLTMVGEGEDGDECDLEIELTENGPGKIRDAAVRLIDRAFERWGGRT